MVAREFVPARAARRRIFPIRAKERMALSKEARARALQRQNANKVAGIIFSRARKAPKMNLIEGLPKSMSALEKQLQIFKDRLPHAVKKDDFCRHGPGFIKLYDMILKSIGYKVGQPLTREIKNRQYFPTPPIKEAIANLRQEIKADPSMHEISRKNSIYSLKYFNERNNVGQFVNSILIDRVAIAEGMKQDVGFSSEQLNDLITALERAQKKMPDGSFTPVQQAQLYIELYSR